MAKSFLRRIGKRFFIICNIAVAILFLSGAYVRYFNPEHWWFIGLLTLCLPYLLSLLIIFFICWLFAKKLWMLISFVSIAISWTAVKNVFPIHFSADFKIEKNVSNIRIMSWNVEHFDILEYKTHPETKQKMLDLIKQYQPDVACFQEMVGGDYSKAINYLGDFKRVLQFSGYYYSYENKLDYDKAHHFGIITFSKFPIINKQTVSIAPHDYNSTFQYTDIIANADTIRIFNIHLQSLRLTANNLQYLDNPSMNTDTAFTESKNIISKLKHGFLRRKLQAEKIKEELLKSPYPVALCGDFNDV
ncbi:MAG: endonuclease/exonuclease/phosphatase family protein, partial [Bacteroidota bacterium]|nr:endonuclease/exonuclease/phosphatase family protein [Bacteroidota bacterium]